MKRLFNCARKGSETDADTPTATDNGRSEQPGISWKHSQLSNTTQNVLSQSPFDSLPNEILLRMFGFLSVPDLCHVSLVCRRFKIIADQDEIWKYKGNGECHFVFIKRNQSLTCHVFKASIKLYSKSYKHIYIDWIREKCLRNEKLRGIMNDDWYETACVMISPPSYPIRPTGKHAFEPIRGFHQHPNSSSAM